MENCLQVENVSKFIGDIVLFENISFTINDGEKVALIAKNGAGKTSLLNIVAGADSPDAGNVTFKKDIAFAYLRQDPVFNPRNTIMEEVYESEDEIGIAVKEYELAVNNNDKKLLQECTERMDALGAWDYDVKVKQILSQLKLGDLNQKMNHLSGGQLKRVALAKVLLKEVDLYILDEPTNHLDLEMVEWLESYLSKTKSSILMVTHDRYFLDRVCNVIVEMNDNQIYSFNGNYSYFLEKRDERLGLQNEEVSKARNLLRKELDWMRRMPKARGTKAKYRIDQFYKLKEQASGNFSEGQVNIDVGTSRLGKKIMELKNIHKSYGQLKLIRDFSYSFNRFEKVGIIGKNGTGKTTFLNTITQLAKPDSGSIEIGETIKFGYYKQEGLQFDENAKVIDIVREIGEVVKISDGNQLSASQFLNYFLFPHKVQNHYVYKLSGGEKRRLYLVTVLMQNPNFLILDEPTNDLDILTLNILEDYLANFKGCAIIVSHDRYFMDKIVDHLFVFEGNGIIKDFPGNFTIYREYGKETGKQPKKEPKPEKPTREKNQVGPKKMSYKEKLEFERLEQEIAELEEKKSCLETEISSGKLGPEELTKKSVLLGNTIDEIDGKSDRWLELSELA